MTLTSLHIDISKAIALCVTHGISVSSVKVGKKYAVTVDDNGEYKQYDKKVYAHQIHAAINKTWKAYAAHILSKNA